MDRRPSVQGAFIVPTSRIEIDLTAIGRNVGILRSVLDQPARTAAADAAAAAAAPQPAAPAHRTALCGVIKQDAYGLGASRVMRKLDALGCEFVAVFSLDEARALADVPVTTPILVLMPVRAIERQDPVYRLAVRNRLHLVVHDLAQVTELASASSKLGVRIPVHVQLDTGMARGGAIDIDARQIVEEILRSPRLQLAGVMTHFSSPSNDDAFTRDQAKAFKGWIESIKPLITANGKGLHVHAANTAAALRSRSLHASMVRIGQGLYGFGGESFTDPLAVEFGAAAKQLGPAVRWLSKIVHIHEVPKNWPVGYGRTFKAARPTKVAVVPIGYADGYPIGLSNVGKVVLTGRPYDAIRGTVEVLERPAVAPVIGRVSMDQITIDVTGLPDSLAKVGAEIELIGKDPHGPTHLPTLAKAAGTISHQLLCGLSPRIERIYLSPTGPEDMVSSANPAIAAARAGAPSAPKGSSAAPAGTGSPNAATHRSLVNPPDHHEPGLGGDGLAGVNAPRAINPRTLTV